LAAGIALSQQQSARKTSPQISADGADQKRAAANFANEHESELEIDSVFREDSRLIL